jgi:hypothetical protein
MRLRPRVASSSPPPDFCCTAAAPRRLFPFSYRSVYSSCASVNNISLFHFLKKVYDFLTKSRQTIHFFLKNNVTLTLDLLRNNSHPIIGEHFKINRPFSLTPRQNRGTSHAVF